jgi:hypothetical protein
LGEVTEAGCSIRFFFFPSTHQMVQEVKSADDFTTQISSGKLVVVDFFAQCALEKLFLKFWVLKLFLG